MYFSPPDFNISVVCILRCLYFSLVPVCETWCSALCALARKPNKVKQHLLHLKSSHQTIHAQFHASDDMKSFSFLQTRAKWGGNIEGKLLFWGIDRFLWAFLLWMFLWAFLLWRGREVSYSRMLMLKLFQPFLFGDLIWIPFTKFST